MGGTETFGHCFTFGECGLRALRVGRVVGQARCHLPGLASVGRDGLHVAAVARDPIAKLLESGQLLRCHGVEDFLFITHDAGLVVLAGAALHFGAGSNAAQAERAIGAEGDVGHLGLGHASALRRAARNLIELGEALAGLLEAAGARASGGS